MRDLKKCYRKRVFDENKLIQYGFEKEENQYTLKSKICENQFEIQVVISHDRKVSKLIDLANEEEYVLVDVEESTGEFVGKVKQEYESKLYDIIEKCTIYSVFHQAQSKEVIKYVKEKYHDELEFLWEKFDDNAIWRNKENQKWYGAILTVARNRFGFESEEFVEVLDLRYQKESINTVIDGKKIFPGYHMNKNSWITIILDGTLESEEVFRLIDNSYYLTIGNKCGLAGDGLAQKVYHYLTLIPSGKVVTYKQVAEYVGNKGLARVVGNILHKNPDGDKYPCYKVLNSKGELAEAFVFGGKNVQQERLEKDGIEVKDGKVDLKVYQWVEK